MGGLCLSPEEWISPEELAHTLGLSPATLADWRCKKTGPAYLKVGRKIWYLKNRVSAWLDGKVQETTDGAAKTLRDVELPIQSVRQRVQRNNRLGRHKTKRDASEGN